MPDSVTRAVGAEHREVGVGQRGEGAFLGRAGRAAAIAAARRVGGEGDLVAVLGEGEAAAQAARRQRRLTVADRAAWPGDLPAGRPRERQASAPIRPRAQATGDFRPSLRGAPCGAPSTWRGDARRPSCRRCARERGVLHGHRVTAAVERMPIRRRAGSAQDACAPIEQAHASSDGASGHGSLRPNSSLKRLA